MKNDPNYDNTNSYISGALIALPSSWYKRINSSEVIKFFFHLTAYLVACLIFILGAGFDQSVKAIFPGLNNSYQDISKTFSLIPSFLQTTQNPVYLPLISIPPERSWPMAAANPERTSWTQEEVKGILSPRWYKPIEPYIPPNIQVIAANNTLFISSSRGLYALSAATGDEKWVFPTELPLGNAPTFYNGVVYVGGLDHKLYAINAVTGQGLWEFEADAGFDTNPLIIDDKAFLGNRDGKFYAVYIKGPSIGNLAWSYQTKGAINFSASYKSGVVYFVSNDNHAYALNAQTGALIWKSSKLPGSGFHSWWPVIYQNYLILAGSSGYRSSLPPGLLLDGQHEVEAQCLFPQGHVVNYLIGPRGSDGWINAVHATACIEKYPARRTYIVINRATGQEVSYDFDNDKVPDYAPLLWYGAKAGNRYPAIIGSDGILYQSVPYTTDQYSFRGHVSGWRIGTPNISTPSAVSTARDEPLAYSAGGSVIYWSLCCDRLAGAFDLSKPNPGQFDPSREWLYYDEGGRQLSNMIPGYNVMYRSTDIDTVYGGDNGIYGLHGNQSPPIPYLGKVYMIRSNAVVALDASTTLPTKLPIAKIQPITTSITTEPEQLKLKLADEVQKILNAGHLRPGYGISGNFDRVGRFDCGENLLDYYHDPSDNLLTLIRALPHLSPGMQQSVKTYLQSEFTNYPPYKYVHIGWAAGASRDAFDLPPDIDIARLSMPASANANFGFTGWDFPPHLYYTLWKYAQVFPDSAAYIFSQAKASAPLEIPPSDAVLIEKPFINNSYIAGYLGYLNLQQMVEGRQDNTKQVTLNRLIALRVSSFSKESPYGKLTCTPGSMSGACYCKTMTVARNFLYLTPELALELHNAAFDRVQAAVSEYNRIVPYWFVSEFEATYAEGTIQPLHDVFALFQAKGLILREPFTELTKYLDAPAFPVGDYYYIHNLVTTIESSGR